jgi:hypothetical protein
VLSVRALGSNGLVYDAQTITTTVQSRLAETAAPAPTTMALTSSFADGSTVKDGVDWTASVAGATPDRVEFYIDGKLRHTERSAPYEFGTWDTTQEQNGPHTLLIRAIARDGTKVEVTQNVVVANSAPDLAVTSSIADAQSVAGTVTWSATTAGPAASKVEFLVDGVVRRTDTSAPYTFTWDTTLEKPGAHALVVKAYAGSRVAQQSLSTTVANAVQAPAISSQTLSNGQVVSGGVTWTVRTAGATPDRVEYWIDGVLRYTDTSSPYAYAWDTKAEKDGTHALVSKAYAGTQVVQKSINVTVKNTPVAIATQSLADGQTISGSLTWTVTTSGATPDKVEYWIDGVLRHTEHSAPYEYAWNTKDVPDGTHTLVTKAYAGSQADQKTLTVTVKNTAGPPTPAPTPPPAATLAIASQSLTDGQTVSGSLTWTVTTSGPTPDKVEYWIDGKLRHTEQLAPYEFAWDTKADADGPHALVVKAYAGAAVQEKSLSVTVKNTAAPKVAIVSQTLTDGQALSGTVTWLVTVSGPVQSVQLLIDGLSAGTFTTAPYGGTLDTKQLANGAHTFVTKVTGTDSSTATATIAVTVANS